MVDLYSLAAPTTARKEAAARVARKAYKKRKTRAAQVSVLWEDTIQAATDVAAAAPHPTAAATPQRQTAGAAPREAGPGQGPCLTLQRQFRRRLRWLFRRRLQHRFLWSAPAVTTTAAAFERILAAAG
jgi:hypothetical protein